MFIISRIVNSWWLKLRSVMMVQMVQKESNITSKKEFTRNNSQANKICNSKEELIEMLRKKSMGEKIEIFHYGF